MINPKKVIKQKASLHGINKKQIYMQMFYTDYPFYFKHFHLFYLSR